MPSIAKASTKFSRAAAVLGVGHSVLELENGGRKLWRPPGGTEYESVENAALRFYEAARWTGHAQEGGLILSLIKLASFPIIPKRQRSTFIEALYAQNVGFSEDRYEKSWLLDNIIKSSIQSIINNFDMISSSEWGYNNERTPEFFPTVTIRKILGLYGALGRGRLQSIAATFALNPYDYRAGWPDLTLWRDEDVAFKEIKAPGDNLHESQRRLARDLLIPLGFSMELIEVLPFPGPSAPIPD